jgi:hypothetical protein
MYKRWCVHNNGSDLTKAISTARNSTTTNASTHTTPPTLTLMSQSLISIQPRAPGVPEKEIKEWATLNKNESLKKWKLWHHK